MSREDVFALTKQVSDAFDPEVAAEPPLHQHPLLSQEEAGIQVLEEQDEIAKWRKRASLQMDLLACVVYTMAFLAFLGALWGCFIGIAMYELSIPGILIYATMILIVSAILSVLVQQKTARDTTSDLKDVKKRLQDDNKAQLLALLFLFSAVLITLILLWVSTETMHESWVTESVALFLPTLN